MHPLRVWEHQNSTPHNDALNWWIYRTEKWHLYMGTYPGDILYVVEAQYSSKYEDGWWYCDHDKTISSQLEDGEHMEWVKANPEVAITLLLV